MAERYTQIAVVVTGKIIDVNPFDIPVCIVELIRRKLGFVKQPVLFLSVKKIIGIIEIYRFLVVAD